ncbi:MAG: DUF58 domain-containing protein [Ruminococcaceae bacterium]|nr:DUF58 domain-containing protein [Oscillospiraceae bacterium]
MKEILLKIKEFFFRAVDFTVNTVRTIRRWQKEKNFSLDKGFYGYLILVVIALLATQALISPITSVIFIFIILLPIISLVYMYICTQSIQLDVTLSAEEVEKYQPVQFRLSLINSIFVPINTIEAKITLPRSDGIRSEAKTVALTLPPYGDYTLSSEITFPYRGNYSIGVSDVVCHDIFGMFKYTYNLNIFKNIFVLPRRVTLASNEGDDRSESSTEITSRFGGNDKTEQNDVRQYQIGDSLRAVHWKLSSKTQDLMVKQYSMNKEKRTYIFCDTAARYNAEDEEKYLPDINEFAVDGVVESAISIATSVLTKGGNICLVWFDDRGEKGICTQSADTLYEFTLAYRMFATSPVTVTDKTMADLVKYAVKDPDANYIYVSGCVDINLSTALTEHRTDNTDFFSGNVSKELYSYTPFEKVNKNYLREYSDTLNAALDEISHAAIRVYDARATKNEGQVSR